jgi:hypothetical protein
LRCWQPSTRCAAHSWYLWWAGATASASTRHTQAICLVGGFGGLAEQMQAMLLLLLDCAAWHGRASFFGRYAV